MLYQQFKDEMGVVFIIFNAEKNKKVIIIERILPELVSLHTETAAEKVFSFCRMLKQAGVDMFEVDNGLHEDLLKMNHNLDLIYRIKSPDDISGVLRHQIRYCIVDKNTPNMEMVLKKLNAYGIRATMEIMADRIEELLKIENISEPGKASCIRVLGLSNTVSMDWTGHINQIKDSLGVSFDCCPENCFFSANSLALEAAVNGADVLTTSFSGYGGPCGYAATEEVLAAARFLLDSDMDLDLRYLKRLGEIFEYLSGEKIPSMKPILGEDIFKYESGIHADGIEKNPKTYEPFEPYLVGQERKLAVGKHSGRKAIMQKLDKLNITYEENDLDYLLKSIRERSIQVGRSLYDMEILELALP